MCKDLLLNYPKYENLHIVPTLRASSGLALSSRNTYLTDKEIPFATALYESLREGEKAWNAGLGRDATIARAVQHVRRRQEEAKGAQVELRLDYIEVNDPETFEVVSEAIKGHLPVIISGALWVGRTRLIDNLLLGEHASILL